MSQSVGFAEIRPVTPSKPIKYAEKFNPMTIRKKTNKEIKKRKDQALKSLRKQQY